MGFKWFMVFILAATSSLAWADGTPRGKTSVANASSKRARARRAALAGEYQEGITYNVATAPGPEVVGPVWACNMKLQQVSRPEVLGIPFITIGKKWAAQGVVLCSTPQGEVAHRILVTVIKHGIIVGVDDGIQTMDVLTAEIGISGWQNLNDTFTLGPSVLLTPVLFQAEIGTGLKIRRYDSGISFVGILQFGEGHGLSLGIIAGTEIKIQDFGPI